MPCYSSAPKPLFSVALPLPVTVDPAMKEDFRDENKSGDDFIDRVYRPSYIGQIDCQNNPSILGSWYLWLTLVAAAAMQAGGLKPLSIA